jgi:alkylation response protein AidB-like acyl-CoA dehydrogenase
MAQELTPSQRKWYDLAAKHADAFAERAAEYDLEGKFPFENYAEMKESGYSAMPIPADCNGGGADLLDICIAQNRLAQGCGATALAVNMHFGLPFVMTDLIALGEDGPKELLTRIADEKLIVFGAITDPQVDSYKGITGMGYTTVKAVKEGEGFRINGHKGFGTNSPIGDLFGSSAVYDDPEQGEIGLIFVLPSDTEGLVCLNDWDTMGMRASQSHSWRLENVFVEEDHVFKHNLWEWDKFARGLWSWHGGTFGAVYLGIAKAARDFAINQTRDRTRLPFKHPESYYPGHQFLAAEMDIALHAGWAWQQKIAERLIDINNRDDSTIVEAVAMQYFCMKSAIDVVGKAVDMVGGAALARRLPLERYYRDVRAGTMHPISGFDALELIGKHAFGLHRDVEPRYV